MAAYAAAVSLMHIIDLIENHPSPPISFDKQQLHSLTEVVTFLQEFLEGYVSPYSYSDEADPLEMRIAHAVYATEDVIESYIVDNIHLAAADDDDDLLGGIFDSSEDHLAAAAEEGQEDDDNDSDNDDDDDSHDDGGEVLESYTVDSIQLAAAAAQDEDKQIQYINFYEGLQRVIEAMYLIKKEVMGLVKEKGGLEAELPRNVSVDAASKSRSIESKSAMVGFEDELLQLKERLVGGDSNRQIIPIVGMGGIGKTTLARYVFTDKLIEEHFDICLWATISQDHNIEQTLIEVLSQYRGRGHSSGEKESVAELGQELHKYLFGRRYLVVLDDMWSLEVWDKMRFFFPDCGKRSRVIVTTRMSNLASHLTNSSNSLCMSFLNEVDSWTLFSKTVFGDEDTTFLDLQPQLREIGKKIVGKCKGLPLSIAVIGGLLARSEHTQGYWEYIEENLSSIVNLENEEYCLRVLKLSYNHLPAYLKPCFLYMGMFDEDREINVSKIIHLWVSEGFLKPKKGKKNLEREYFRELVDRNLVLVVDELKSSRNRYGRISDLGWIGDKNIKLCRMHDLVRDLSLREAQKQGFYYVYSKERNHPSRSSHCHSHRRIVIPGESESFHKRKIMLESSSNPRSYLSHDDYAKVEPDSRLLRTIYSHSGDATWKHLYSRDEVFGWVNARLLAVPLDHIRPRGNELGSSISRLWSLHTLILVIHEYYRVPDEFWNMHQLKHVEFIGSCAWLPLPPPPPNNGSNVVILENLHTLIGMVGLLLNEDVVRRLANLTILGVSYVNKIEKRGEVHCFSYLQRLSKLECFRCSITDYVNDDLETISFPQSLKQIHLVRNGSTFDKKIELEGMLQKLGWLPVLEEVVIQNGFFERDEWETEGQFPRLKILELRGYGNLRKWTLSEGSSHFPLLQKLILYQLEELEEIPSEIGEIATLELIDLSYCSISAVLSAKKIVEEQEELYGEDELSFRVLINGIDVKSYI